MTETIFRDDEGNEVQFTRRDCGPECEIIIVKRDRQRVFISHDHFSYSSDKLQSWSSFSENGDLIVRHELEYGTSVWDAWQREFDATGQLLNQTFYTWDKDHQAKAALFYDQAGRYLGKRVDTLEDGKYRPLDFDSEGKSVSFDAQHNKRLERTRRW